MAAHGFRFCPPRIMGYLLTILVLHLLASVTADSKNCQTIVRSNQPATLRCTELTNLMILEAIRANTRTIEISESQIAELPGHAFAKFGATLVTLDLHQSGIETIDSMAFIGLTKLESLILWGNKLRSVPRHWFVNTYNLRTLDLSFNSIDVIDYAVFELLPNLENFYFDYNQIKFIDYSMFAYLRNLKTVKFEKNPLNWGYHALLTWQLENQRVKYTEQWENWGWMNVMIKECTESGYGEIPKDTVLDCLVAKLLDFTHRAFPTVAEVGNICTAPASQLVRCMRPKNATGDTDNETVRRILEDYTAILTPMTNSLGRFSTPIENY
ncbi:uncharacterized protein LOC143372891 [Andrena cerasifolii]|uniref:uncharacterized protein LOC143372891 n=1 Tax=Andrena cerasifolii TaxID=2819439 RepID=UPI00403829DF